MIGVICGDFVSGLYCYLCNTAVTISRIAIEHVVFPEGMCLYCDAFRSLSLHSIVYMFPLTVLTIPTPSLLLWVDDYLGLAVYYIVSPEYEFMQIVFSFCCC